jgi:peptide/nickel transport system substrate-binding protein
MKKKISAGRLIMTMVLLLSMSFFGACSQKKPSDGGTADAAVESDAKGSVRRGGIVNVTSTKQGVLIKNFNPFSPNALQSTFGCFYETLVFANEYSGEVTPWLAERYSWSEDLKSLEFHLRKDVKWNDGEAFDADDVIFTLELAKGDKALDKAGIWNQGLVDVKKIDAYTIDFTFEEVNTTVLPQMASLYIMPEHIWASVDNPSEWTGNENPVGTGPFVFDEGSFTEQSYRLKRNPLYWQLGEDGKPLPYIDGVQYVGATGNAQAQMKIISGEVDWGAYFLANIDETYVKRDPDHNHYWLPEGNIVYLNLNNGKEPFSNRNVRRALAMAIDQKEITTIMNSGAVPAGQAGVKTGYLSWVPEDAESFRLSFDPDAAVRLLESEGYAKNAKGIMEKDGKALSFELYVPTGWTDWITAVETVSNQLKEIGIDARVNQAAWPSPFLDNITTGNYDISIDYVNSGFSPYYQYNNILPSRHWAPVGEDATGHSQVRYRNEKLDQAFSAYRRTADKNEQLGYIHTILSAVMEDTPLVPLFFNPTWYEYSTRNFTGWPKADDPYTVPKTAGMDKMPVFLNLQPKN